MDVRSAGGWQVVFQHIAHHCGAIADYLEGANLNFPRPVTVANIPYGFLRRSYSHPGVYFVGDQLAVIPSLTGDGMTIALRSARAAVRHLLASTSGDISSPQTSYAYQNEMVLALSRQLAISGKLHRLFKHHQACDFLIGLMNWMPDTSQRNIERMFIETRCRIQ
jgi:flavin-dependent dehydrogenase